MEFLGAASGACMVGSDAITAGLSGDSRMQVIVPHMLLAPLTYLDKSSSSWWVPKKRKLY